MRPAYYEERWIDLKNSTDPAAIESLSHRIAASFIDRYYYNDEYQRDYIRLLCEMATHFDDPALSRHATSALFGIVIERLCDDFEELQTETYNRLICQVVNFLCDLPEGAALETALTEFGLRSEEQLYERIESMRVNPDRPIAAGLSPKKVLVLSRVTIGADVAITSVICQRVQRHFPECEIVVIGNEKLRQIIAIDSNIRVAELPYSRRGGLLERFLVWLDLLQILGQETAGLASTEYLVLDPDSRLTQLGVLPLLPLENYRFFNSRGKQGYSAKASVAQLVNLWLDQVLSESQFCYPTVWLDARHEAAAQQAKAAIAQEGEATLLTANFGVGGNTRKLVPGNFEPELICSLLADSKLKIFLDMGFGDEERQRSEAILRAARQAGIGTQELSYAELGRITPDTRLIGIRCSIGEVAALISVSDEFIGYDSACQHIAAARGVRTFTVFAGSNNVRFIRRWHACGENSSEILYVDTISRHEVIDNDEIISRLQDLRNP